MRVLFFQWYSFMNKGIEKALKILNLEYSVFLKFVNKRMTDIWPGYTIRHYISGIYRH